MEAVLIATTLFLLIWAATMTVIVWRISGNERRRAAARIAALAADLSEPVTHQEFSLPATDIFGSAGATRSSSRLTAVLAVGFFAVVTALVLTVAASRGGQTLSKDVVLPTSHDHFEAKQAPGPTDSPRLLNATIDSTPLELTALAHDRVADGITIRGIVRNPSSGVEWRNLTAVAFLFSRDGQFLTSGRAAIQATALLPGAESIFVVSVPNASDVGRYRISFRSEDRIVPHHDRRDRGRVVQLK
jgi:preprotein translocase subunit SecG